MKHDFKYFKDVLKYASFSEKPCDCCGNEDLCLQGIYFDLEDDDIESVCLECLVKGKVTVDIPEYVCDKLYHELRESCRDKNELQKGYAIKIDKLSKTPPIPWVQYNDWTVCCGDFMKYIGEWTREDLISNSKDGNGKKYFLEILDSSLKPQIDDIDVIWDQLGKYIIVYVFECIKCNKITAIVQSF